MSDTITPQAAPLKVMTLLRVADLEYGTFGVLFDESLPFALTMERRWLNNKKGESCIPKGEYDCERVKSPRFGDTFEVKNVQGRSEILFHKGNLDDDSHGCILVGEKFDPVKDSYGIAASGDGFSEFLKRLSARTKFKLIVKVA